MPSANLYQPGRAWFMAILLALFMLINFIDKVGIGLVAVPMMTELKLTPTEFGWIAGSFFWLFAISGVIGGFIANRVSAKWLLMVLVTIWSLAQLPIMLSSSIAMIVLSRVLLGVGEGPASPVAFHACYKWFPDAKRNLPISVINLGSSIGLLLAGFSVPLITANWGWRFNFVIMALIGVGWGLLWLVFGAEGQVTGTGSEASVARPVRRAPRLPYRVLLTDPTVVGVWVLHFTAFWGLALTLTWLPAYLQKGLGFEAVASGRLFALVVLINIPISLGLSAWSQRLLARGTTSRRGRAVLCSLSLMAGGALFVTLLLCPMSNMNKVLLLAVASGLTPVIYSLGSAMMASVSPDSQRGAMLSIQNSIASIAGVMAPVVMGRLIETTDGSAAAGYELGFAMTGALLIIGGLIGLAFVNPERSVARLAATPGDAT